MGELCNLFETQFAHLWNGNDQPLPYKAEMSIK